MTTQRHTVDVNADAGESYGNWLIPGLEALFSHVTSVNLACGFHAGDPVTMHAAVRSAKAAGNAVGAHPGYPDLVGFGRRDMDLSAAEVHAAVLYQIGALAAFVRVEGMVLRHVKPHGALYLRMARNPVTADAVARAVAEYDADLPLMVLGGAGGAIMQEAAQKQGLRIIREAFPDRAYLADGSLAPRTMPGALIHDPARVAERAVAMVIDRVVEAVDGAFAPIEAETLCIHGDNAESIVNAAAVRRALAAAGVDVQPA